MSTETKHYQFQRTRPVLGIALLLLMVVAMLRCINQPNRLTSVEATALVAIRAGISALAVDSTTADSIRFEITAIDSPDFFFVRSYPFAAHSATAETVPCNVDLLVRITLLDRDGNQVCHGTQLFNNSECESLTVVIDDAEFSPLAPAFFSVRAVAENAATLTWADRADNESGYILERSRGTAAYVAIDTVQDTSWLDDGLRPSKTYRYRISAYNANGRSPFVTAGEIQTPGPDKILPQLSVQSHSDADTLNHRSFVLYGTTFDASGIHSVTVNDTPTQVYDGFWISDSITITGDSVNLSVVTTDSSPSANFTTLELTIYYREVFVDTSDTTPPVIRLLSHNWTDTSNARVTRLFGLAVDENGIRSLRVNDSVLPVLDNFWELAGVVLEDSLNEFVVRAVDNSGDTNITIDTVRIWYNPDYVPITNSAPLFLVSPTNLAEEIKAGLEYRKILVATDPDSFNVLSFVVDTPLTLVDDSIIEWSPLITDMGTHYVYALVKDQDSALDSIAWTIRILDPSTNFPPVFRPNQARYLEDSAIVQVLYRDTLEATDADQDSGLVFSKKNGPLGLHISDDGIISWLAGKADVGVHPCTAQVVDDLGASALVSWTIAVYDSSLPVVNAGNDTTVSISDIVNLHGTASRKGGSISRYEWDIGSLGTLNFKQTSGSDTSFSAKNSVDSNFVCVLRAFDNFNKYSTDSVRITIIQDPPVAAAGRDTALQTEEPYTLQGTGTDNYGTIVKYEWDIGNTGTWVESPDGQYEDSTPSVTGPITCVLRVTDDDGNVATDEMTVNVIQLSMVLIEAEVDPQDPTNRVLRFTMGSDDGREDEAPAHPVKLSPFWIDTTEVRQGEFETVMNIAPSGQASLPVVGVTWFDAVLFCNARSRRDGFQEVYSYTASAGTGSDGRGTSSLSNLQIKYDVIGYRLPTEAEWEFACRAPSGTDYPWGNDSANAGLYSWYAANSSAPKTVGSKLSNVRGLYDMTGNVQEWCNDWYSPSYYATFVEPDTAYNPTGPATTTGSRVLRGGSYQDPAAKLRCSYREFVGPQWQGTFVGFRCVLPVK